MATKKAASNTSLVKWSKQLADLANAATDTEKNVGAGGNFLGIKSGVLTYKGAAVPQNKLTVVVVDHIIEYADYEGEFDPDNPQGPRCFAFGRDEKTLEPHADTQDKQSDTCANCANNEYGTADRGKGKHCKNSRRLALIPQGDLEEVPAAEVAYLKVPVTSVKTWAGYVRQIAEVLKRPPLGVLTEISLHPDPKNQIRMEFKLIEAIDDGELIGALLEKKKIVEKEIDAPYVFIEKEEKPARGGKNKATKPQAKATKRKF